MLGCLSSCFATLSSGERIVVQAGASADLQVVDANPLADLTLLMEQGAHLPVIMKPGAFCKQVLA